MAAWAQFWLDPEQLQASEDVDAERVQQLRTASRAEEEEDRLWAS